MTEKQSESISEKVSTLTTTDQQNFEQDDSPCKQPTEISATNSTNTAEMTKSSISQISELTSSYDSQPANQSTETLTKITNIDLSKKAETDPTKVKPLAASKNKKDKIPKSTRLNEDSSQENNLEGDLSARPKRRSTKSINYSEKLETDIPSIIHTDKTEKRTRRKQQLSDSTSTSPPPSSSSSNSHAYVNNGSYYDLEDIVPINYQPPLRNDDNFNELIDLKTAKIDASETILTLKNGQKIRKGDCIYMICEPPTEPYYIAKVIGFTKKDKTATVRKASNYNFSVCWFYRPRDLNRRSVDTRLVYASLHRDNCPIASFRGMATVKHKSEIEDLEVYKQEPDSFYFDKLYDRYMIKMYDMIPTIKLIHLPPNYYTALNKRFEFIFVEVGKADELLSSPKNCEKCLQWCSSSDSIPCSGCQKSYHLLCLDPPILTKPKRGFAWYCAACNKHLEDKLAENRGKMLESAQPSQIMKAEAREQERASSVESEQPENSQKDTDNETETNSDSLRYEQAAKRFLEGDKHLSLSGRRDIEEWPYRYLGVHAKFEDALDLQDRPYARAASRLGSKYQCTSLEEWYDHEVQYYDTNDSSSGSGKKLKKYYNRSKKSATPFQKETDLIQDKKFLVPEEYKEMKTKDYPGWLQPKPKGYIERGGDETSTLLWKMPSTDEPINNAENAIDKYIHDCAGVAERLNLSSSTTPNFFDAILLILMNHNYNPEESMLDVHKLTRESLKEPTFSPEEVQRFEDSVRIHGSELYPVYKDVKTQSAGMVVRFYYLWKKTKMGHEIWDNFSGRAKNRLKVTHNSDIDLENPEDDGTYLGSKITKSKFKFKCVYCEANHSPEWFKAPGAIMNEADLTSDGSCSRCAKLWRKYAVKWENPIELIKNQEKKSSHTFKRKLEQALVQEAEFVVKARDNYLVNPKKKSENLKKFKTIDSDYDYSYFASEKIKKKVIKRSPKKTSKPENVSTSTIEPLVDTKIKLKKEKKSEATDTPKKTTKRPLREVKAKKEIQTSDGNGDGNEEEVKPKKRKYTKRQVVDKGIKFVYNNNSNDASTVNEAFEHDEPQFTSASGEYDRVGILRAELEATTNQLQENSKSGIFNAFLDMKLRERIEYLEKELSMSKPVESKINSNQPDMDNGTDGTSSVKDENSKKFLRRRVYLSKTSVPGSGVFETPPVQMPVGDKNNSMNPCHPKNKFVFQMYGQNGESSEFDIAESEFQSQPQLFPSPEMSEMFSTPPQMFNAKPIPGQTPTSSSSSSSLLPSNQSKSLESKESESLSNASNKEVQRGSTEAKSLIPASEHPFNNVSSHHNEYLSLLPVSTAKALLPLIDSVDEVSTELLSRYTSKFALFNPLISDDLNPSPVYQLRPSSKELNVLWKQYQTSKKSKGRSGKSFIPLYPSNKRACCVCRELGDTTKMLICSNCGLNVHASCYGKTLDPSLQKDAGEFNWHCDPCSNDLHPLISTQYICLLCNSRESNMDQAIKGDEISIPDALKRTIEGRWCHVVCATLCEEVKFGSPSLQPICGTHTVGVKNIFQPCDICTTNGGAVLKCEFCPKKSHATCGMDYGWKMGFKLVKIFDVEDGDIIKVKSTGFMGRMKPILYCEEHNRSDQGPIHADFTNIYDITELGTKLTTENEEYKSLMELYLSDSDKILSNVSVSKIRKRCYDEMSNAFDELASRSNDRIVEEIEALKTQLKSPRCSECFKTTSLVWYPNNEEGEMCHLCHSKKSSVSNGEYDIPDLSSVNQNNFDIKMYN